MYVSVQYIHMYNALGETTKRSPTRQTPEFFFPYPLVAGFHKRAMRSRVFKGSMYGVLYNTYIHTYILLCTYTVQECSIFLLENFHLPFSPLFGLEMYRFFSYIQKMQPYSLLPINLLLLSLVTAAPAPAPAPAPEITYNPTKEASCLVKWTIQTNRDITEHYEVTGHCMFLGSVDTLCRGGYRAPGFCPSGMYINPIFPLLYSSFLICSYKKNCR